MDGPTVVVGLDLVISFGAGERIVNDNEHSLILAARRIVRGLGCCCRLICHTGQAAARAMVLDQYASRGGSALADGSRMVTVLQVWEDADRQKLAPPIGFTLGAGEQGIVLARAKISYAPPQPRIWLKRRGWTFQHFIDMPATKEDEARERADQIWRYLADQLKSGARHSQKTLEDSGVMPRAKLRAALSSLMAAGRVIYAPLPEELRHGGRQDYLHPVEATSPGGANERDVGQKSPTTSPGPEAPSTSPPPFGHERRAALSTVP